jgi:hypothetical protein
LISFFIDHEQVFRANRKACFYFKGISKDFPAMILSFLGAHPHSELRAQGIHRLSIHFLFLSRHLFPESRQQ